MPRKGSGRSRWANIREHRPVMYLGRADNSAAARLLRRNGASQQFPTSSVPLEVSHFDGGMSMWGMHPHGAAAGWHSRPAKWGTSAALVRDARLGQRSIWVPQ